MYSSCGLSDVSIDVCLIAVILAMHVTKKDQNLKLLLIALMVAHIVFTTESLLPSPSKAVEPTDEPTDSSDARNKASDSDDIVPRPVGANGVSSSGFSRQFSSPDQLSRTHDILPASSRGANGKLVDARTSFFSDIIEP